MTQISYKQLHSNDRDHSASNKRIKTGYYYILFVVPLSVLQLKRKGGLLVLHLCSVSPCNIDLGFGVGGNSFASRLRLHPEKDKNFAPLAGQLLRKYISFAREHVHPRYLVPFYF